jgi:hypothetical protein
MTPYNNRFNLMSLGRHGACLRKPHAGDPTHLSLPGQVLRPRSQVNRTLYGLIEREERRQ